MDANRDSTQKRSAEEVLRSYPPRPAVRRLRPRAIAIIFGAFVLVLGGRMSVKLFDQHTGSANDDQIGLGFRATDDMLQRGPIGRLPADYSFIPPPTPPPAPPPPKPEPVKDDGPPESDREALKRLEALRKEMEAAMDSPILFAGRHKASASTAPPQPPARMEHGLAVPNPYALHDNNQPRSDAHNRSFLRDAANIKTRVSGTLESPLSPYELKAGTIIPAALVTAINSDLPGDIIGQVTVNVYDSITGRYLLVPQGTRMIGKYNSEILNGQNRILIAWQRLILPNGKSITLEAMPGTDAAGVSGVADLVDYHAAQLTGATLLSTLVALGGNFAATVDREQQALAITANTVTQQSSRVAQRIIDRELNIKPTIMIRSGLPLNILVNRDLQLVPYKKSVTNRR